MQYTKHFIPLESDPRIFTKLMHDLGTLRSLQFIDIPSLDEDILELTPRPVLALILVLPPCPAYEREHQRKSTEQTSNDYSNGEVLWLKQTINNACGLYAIIHSVCNLPFIIQPMSALDRLTNALDRESYLENSKEIEKYYGTAALDGLSEAPSAEEDVDHHYICLIKHADRLYLLDGDMEGPVDRGVLMEDEDMLAKKALNVVREYLNSNQDGTFSLLALINHSK